MKTGFDPNKYLEEQTKFISERVNHYDKLYLEFGGKLYDKHARRVLPGFNETAKIEVLKRLADKLEVLICIYSGDIERRKTRGDSNTTYDMEVLRLIDDLRMNDLHVNSVVITRYENLAATNHFVNKLERQDIKVYRHRATKDYPGAVETIVSDEGYGKNPYIVTSRPIVVVTGPGPGSGKMATCLSQLYHEHKRGVVAGYSKYETFPIWNLPLKHPVNVAYEAATVDLKDVNMIDYFHVEAYNHMAVNYNRDLETFPLLKRIIEKITSKPSVYKSPTDMGVNRAGFGIFDDAIVQEAAKQEIIRRQFKVKCDYKKGYLDQDSVDRMLMIMDEVGLKPEDRRVVLPAREKAASLRKTLGETANINVTAMELNDGTLITGKSSSLMDAPASVLLNAIKHHANIADSIHLISPVVLTPIQRLKDQMRGSDNVALNAQEVLIALSISAATSPTAQVAMDQLPLLAGCQAHSTTMLSDEDERVFRELGIESTTEPVFPSSNLFYDM